LAHKVRVVGTGPGSEKYITPIALEAIRDAGILVGGQRLLDTFGHDYQEKFPIKNNLTTVIKYIKEKMQFEKIVVLVSGDTGIFSFANYLLKHIDSEDLEFIPGISSLQIMFARLKKPWNEAQILSLHGRSLDILPTIVKESPITALLTGNPWTPQKIARFLLDNQITGLKVAIGKDLSYPHEKIVHTTLDLLFEDKQDYTNSVMVIFNE
jgi:cobalt-precorrin-7 (C5)-methyltransferase